MAKKVVKKSKKNIKNESNEKFSFDNEIVIGVTKMPETKKVEKKNKTDLKKHKNDIKKKNNNKVKKENVQNIENNKNIKKKKQVNTNKVVKNNNIQSKKNQSKEIQNKIKEENIIDREYKKVKNKRKLNTKLIKYIFIVILFIVLVICAMFSPLFNIKNIIIEENEKISKEEIISLSKLQVEENIFKLSKNKIEKQIKQNPYIESIKIERKLPSTVVIKVEERKQAYLLEYAGSYVYIDKQGYMLEINTEKLELPIIQGAETLPETFIEGNRLINEDLEKLEMVYKIMEVAQVNQIANLITRIDIEDEKDLKLIFETEGKTAYIGDITNLITKIPTIKLILEEEKGKTGEIFVNMDLNNEYPMFRQSV